MRYLASNFLVLGLISSYLGLNFPQIWLYSAKNGENFTCLEQKNAQYGCGWFWLTLVKKRNWSPLKNFHHYSLDAYRAQIWSIGAIQLSHTMYSGKAWSGDSICTIFGTHALKCVIKHTKLLESPTAAIYLPRTSVSWQSRTFRALRHLSV